MIGFCKICALGIFFFFFLENNSFKMNPKISVWKEAAVHIHFLPWTVFLGPGLAGKLSRVAFLRAHDPILAHKDLNPCRDRSANFGSSARAAWRASRTGL